MSTGSGGTSFMTLAVSQKSLESGVNSSGAVSLAARGTASVSLTGMPARLPIAWLLTRTPGWRLE
jgi:hypothetical protein